MNKKSLLTSIVALGFVMPAFADDVAGANVTSEFPATNYMQENTIYKGLANIQHMLVDSGTVYAIAEYTVNDYPVTPGYYLPAGEDSIAGVESCPAGSYCPGGIFQYDSSADQILTACSTLTGGYNSSDSGSNLPSQCYKSCDSASFANSSEVTGRDYYGYGLDTCNPTSCVSGWHTVTTMKTVDLDSAIGEAEGVNSAYVASSFNGWTTYQSADSVLLGSAVSSEADAGLWWVNYGSNQNSSHGLLIGRARLSNVQADGIGRIKDPTEVGDPIGENCYCGVLEYNSNDVVSSNPTVLKDPWVMLTSPWAYAGTANTLGECARKCSDMMRLADAGSLAFRDALFGVSGGTSVTTCVANTINIRWNFVDGNQVAGGGTMADYSSVNHTGSTSVDYGGDIFTPVKALSVPGKTFSGWVFSTTPPSNQ